MTLDIKALAEQAGMLANRELPLWMANNDDLTRFARAVLEEAAKRCIKEFPLLTDEPGFGVAIVQAQRHDVAVRCAEAIRALLPSEPTK